MTKLTQEYLRSRIYYDLLTGKFWWKPKEEKTGYDHGWNLRYAGKEAGSVNNTRYGKVKRLESPITVDEVSYKAHRLAWFYMLGEWPEEVDHEDHNSLNNSWINLARSTHKQNGKNQSKYKSNKSGVTGVHWNLMRNKWQVSIRVEGRAIYGGLYSSFEEAVARRKELELAHGFHPNHGK